MEVVRKLEGQEARNYLEKGIQDSSYLVAASALEGLYRLLPVKDSQHVAEEARSIQGLYRSPEVLLEVATVLSVYGNKEDLAFFHSTPNYLRPQYITSFLNTYKDYLVKGPVSRVNAELTFIKKMKDKVQSSWSKLGYRSFVNELANLVETDKFKIKDLTMLERQDIAEELRNIAGKTDLRKPDSN